MSKMLFITLIFFLLGSSSKSKGHNFKTMKDFYDYFQPKMEAESGERSWSIGKSFSEDLPYDQVIQHKTSVIPEDTGEYKEVKLIRRIPKIPKSFDAREEWPECESIGKFHYNQNLNCSATWALTAAAVITDRICIASGANTKPEVSISDILKCCKDCFKDDGCKGGKPYEVWKFWVQSGLLQGTVEDCLNGTCKYTNCNSRKGKKSYGKRSYKILKDVTQIQADIMVNGPVQATYRFFQDKLLYENAFRLEMEQFLLSIIVRPVHIHKTKHDCLDFCLYSGRVYEHSKGNFSGYDTVKIIGWGVDKDKPFWLVLSVQPYAGERGGVWKLTQMFNRGQIAHNVVGGEVKSNVMKTVHIPGQGGASKIFRLAFTNLLIIVFAVFYCFNHTNTYI